MLGRVAGILTYVVAAWLILLVVMAMVGAVHEAMGPLLVRRDFTHAALRGVDAAFLAIILLELVHTTLSRGPIYRRLQEFLVIGITAGVRSGLEVAVAADGEGPRDMVVNLALNSAGVLALVGALWLARHRLRADRAGDA